MKKRTIYIPVNGIGLGHARRSLRIGEALSKHYDVIFSTYKTSLAFSYLLKSNCKVIGIPNLSWAKSADGGLDKAKTLSILPYGAGVALSHLLIERYLIFKMNPVAVISDMRAAPIMISTKENIPCFMLGLFFDLKKEVDSWFVRQPARLLGGFIRELARWCIKTFVTDFPPPYTFYERLMPERIPSNFIFTGPIIDRRLEVLIKNNDDIFDLKAEAKRKLGIREEKVVLFLPSGLKKARDFFINGVLRLFHVMREYKDIKFIISLGLIEEKVKKLYERGNIEIWTWLYDITDYLLSADLIVGYYGMNKVFDSVAAGSLFLGKVATNHVEQLALAKRIKSLGIGDLFDSFNEKLLDKMINLLNEDRSFKTLSYLNKLIKQMRPIETILKTVNQNLN